MKLPEPVAWMLDGEPYIAQQCRFFSKSPGEVIPGQVPLFTEAQLHELLSKQEAVMQQALEVIELHPYPGWDHVWETKQALKRLLNKE